MIRLGWNRSYIDTSANGEAAPLPVIARRRSQGVIAAHTSSASCWPVGRIVFRLAQGACEYNASSRLPERPAKPSFTHMAVSSVTISTAPVPGTIETRGSWIVCLTALGIAAVSFAAPAITVVGLKSIAADLGGERSVPALAYSLAWLGASFGGIPMGRAAERFGIRFTVIFSSAMIAVGLVIAQSGGRFGLFVGYGLFVGLLGNSGINAPLYIYVSRWFDRRRGTALALFGSGSSISAGIWAPIFAVAEAHVGWRYTMLGFAALEIVLILPAAALVFGPAPEAAGAEGDRHGPWPGAPVLGLKPAMVLSGLCTAGFLCCVPMAMPQGHLVAFCSDVGIPASQARRCFRCCSAAPLLAASSGAMSPTGSAAYRQFLPAQPARSPR
jgi:MFS family permease